MLNYERKINSFDASDRKLRRNALELFLKIEDSIGEDEFTVEDILETFNVHGVPPGLT